MIDTWATVGSCAQIGAECHISGGAGIGGVLEPLQANPVIVEDNCFIGARSEVAEGVVIEEGSVLAMGVYVGASTKIVDRATGEVRLGRIPAYSVVVPGTLPGRPLADGSPGPALYCAVIVKRGEHGVLIFDGDDMFSAPAFPLDNVVDPTGAGDSFAGGFMGVLAATGDISSGGIRRAAIVGSVMGSFAVQDFSVDRLTSLTTADIQDRFDRFVRLTQFDGFGRGTGIPRNRAAVR